MSEEEKIEETPVVGETPEEVVEEEVEETPAEEVSEEAPAEEEIV